MYTANSTFICKRIPEGKEVLKNTKRVTPKKALPAANSPSEDLYPLGKQCTLSLEGLLYSLSEILIYLELQADFQELQNKRRAVLYQVLRELYLEYFEKNMAIDCFVLASLTRETEILFGKKASIFVRNLNYTIKRSPAPLSEEDFLSLLWSGWAGKYGKTKEFHIYLLPYINQKQHKSNISIPKSSLNKINHKPRSSPMRKRHFLHASLQGHKYSKETKKKKS